MTAFYRQIVERINLSPSGYIHAQIEMDPYLSQHNSHHENFPQVLIDMRAIKVSNFYSGLEKINNNLISEIGSLQANNSDPSILASHTQ